MQQPTTEPFWTEDEQAFLRRRFGASPRDAWNCLEAAFERGAPVVCDKTPRVYAVRGAYFRRLGNCLRHHADQPAGRDAPTFDELVRRAEAGELIPGERKENLLLDVLTAHAMELRHNKAALRFEQEYLPRIVGLARRKGGEAAVEAVENFGAELIMSREGRPPRIADYQGRTTLNGWLRIVVSNFVISRSRKKQALSGVEIPEVCARAETSNGAAHDCEPLLRPLFAQVTSAVDAERRLLLKLLLVDEVPQQQVAKALGIASGNVTRRRQKATADLLEQVGRMAAERKSERRVAECLDTMLAGEDRALSERLGAVLAAGLSGQSSRVTEDDES